MIASTKDGGRKYNRIMSFGQRYQCLDSHETIKTFFRHACM